MNTELTPPTPESAPPPPERHLGHLIDLLIFFLAALVLFLFVQFAAVALALYDTHQQNPDLDWSQVVNRTSERVQYNAFFLVPVQVVYYALLSLALYWLVRRRGLPFWKGLALKPLPFTRAIPALFVGGALAILIQFANVLVPPPEKLPFDKLFTDQAAAGLIIAASLLVAPLVEEMVFRGYIYGVAERLWGVFPAVLLSGLLFGAIHFPQLFPGYFQMILLCVVGLTFSWVRARTGTLLASILVHFGYNAAISALFLASEQFRTLPPAS